MNIKRHANGQGKRRRSGERDAAIAHPPLRKARQMRCTDEESDSWPKLFHPFVGFSICSDDLVLLMTVTVDTFSSQSAHVKCSVRCGCWLHLRLAGGVVAAMNVEAGGSSFDADGTQNECTKLKKTERTYTRTNET